MREYIRRKRFGDRKDTAFKNYFTYGATSIPHDRKTIREGKGGVWIGENDEERFKIHEDQWCREGDDAWVASHNLLVIADGSNGSIEVKDQHTGLYSKVLVADLKVMTEQDPRRDLRKVLTHSVAVNPVHRGSSTVCLA